MTISIALFRLAMAWASVSNGRVTPTQVVQCYLDGQSWGASWSEAYESCLEHWHPTARDFAVMGDGTMRDLMLCEQEADRSDTPSLAFEACLESKGY